MPVSNGFDAHGFVAEMVAASVERLLQDGSLLIVVASGFDEYSWLQAAERVLAGMVSAADWEPSLTVGPVGSASGPNGLAGFNLTFWDGDGHGEGVSRAFHVLVSEADLSEDAHGSVRHQIAHRLVAVQDEAL
jgi:hypothetical protein